MRFLPPSARGREVLGLIIIVVSILGAVAWLPARQAKIWASNVPADQLPQLTNEFRQTIAQIVGGLLVFVTVYVGWRRLNVSEQQQITERFTRAVDQLGHEKEAVRIGGIYALERIAKDSPRDRWSITEILSAFVRQSSPREPLVWRGDRGVSLDFEAAMIVLGRRDVSSDRSGLDLTGAYLKRLKLRSADFRFAIFQEADLEDARVAGCDFSDADFTRAKLEGINLEDTGCVRTSFIRANLRTSLMVGTNCAYANFDYADLLNADLTRANLSGADLRGARNVQRMQLEDATVSSDTREPAEYIPDGTLEG